MAMANLRSVGNLFSSGYHTTNNVNNNKSIDDIVHCGNLAKRKNNKSRYFVLRRETNKDNLSRLEYYESEKKFKEGRPLKKKYLLKSCSRICQKPDVKNKWMVTLYFHKNSVSFIAGNEKDMNDWLQNLNNLKGNPTIEYRHVWQVDIQPRSFTELSGQHFMCLTNRILSLEKNDTRTTSSKEEVQLSTIRRCGHVHQFFFVELGRNSGLGSGMLWMICEDQHIAGNINEIVGNAMNHKADDTIYDEKMRARTYSVTDTPKSETIPQRSRSESMPGAKSQTRSFSRIPPSFGSHSSNESVSSDEDPFILSANIDHYSKMTPDEIAKTVSSSNITKNLSATNDDDSEYVMMMSNMDPVDPVPSSSLHLPLQEASDSFSQSSLSPGVNCPWIGKNQLQSPSDSRNSLSLKDTPDGYTPMMPPNYSFTTSTSPYLPMGRGMDKISAPIPVSPTDGDSYYEMSPNSGSSSMTSGTLSSDHRNNDMSSERDIGSSEEMDPLEMRTIRTSSVGSRSEHSKRKNRLDAVTVGEPSRVRAFSVGSRVSLKFGVRLGGTQPPEPPADNLGQLFPSIKETGKRAKDKSSSAPMLAPSFVSRSCPGTTPGSYFRGFLQGRNQQYTESYKMEIDLSKNNSYDYIPGDEKDRKPNKDRRWHTLKGYRRPRSDSKSSGTSKCSEGESTKVKRLSESDPRGMEIPTVSNDQDDYCKVNYSPSPRISSSESPKGYVPMYPPNSSYISTTQGSPHQPSETNPDLPSSLSSTDLQTQYVDMTQGTSTPPSSVPHGLLLAPTSSQEQLSSPTDDFMPLDLQVECDSSSHYKGKKGNKRKSFKESAKRKKPDTGPGRGETDSPDSSHKSKTANVLSTLTNFISRKPNSSKAPLSPLGSPLPKSTKDSVNPLLNLNLTRNKCKTSKEELNFEKEDSLSPGHRRIASLSSQLRPPNTGTYGKNRSGSMDMTIHSMDNREDDKMLFDPIRASKLFEQSDSKTDRKLSPSEKRASDYMNLNLSDEATSGSLPSLNFTDVPDYMNMHPGKSSPQLSPPAYKKDQVPCMSADETTQPSLKVVENSYMLMSAPSKNKVNLSNITRRPDIPATLLACQYSSLGLEKLSVNDEQSSTERARSHSGPDGGISGKCKKKGAIDGGPYSACSSPISYSPPTSPTLGSVSSLSEGGLSSASSTCTVISVGLAKQAVAPTAFKPIPSSDSFSTVVAKQPSIEVISSSCCKDEDVVNYVCLDLCEGSKNQSNAVENKSAIIEEASSNYVAIDFTKSEGLRNTSLTRGTRKPH